MCCKKKGDYWCIYVKCVIQEYMESDIKKRTKKNLKEAFWQLYEKKEVSKITVKDVTTLAGYNRSTFYEYFKDVYDVLEQLEESLIKKPLMPFKKSKEGKEVESIIMALSEEFERNKRYFSVLLGDNGDPRFRSKVQNKIKPKIREKLEDLGVKDENKINILIEYQVSAMLGIMIYIHTSENPPKISELFEVVNSLNRHGLKETVESMVSKV